MSLATAELPSDLPALRAFALACQGELKAAELAVQYKALEIEKLKFQIAKLRRMQFGRSSERINHQIAQLELRLEELEAGMAEDATRAEAKAEAAEPAAPIRERSKPKRRPLPDHLPRQEVVHQPADDGACTCPDCGRGMARLGEDVTEVLDYVPGPITEVACWAHCRRKIFDVWDATKSPVAKEALDRIAAIYVIEDKARFAPLPSGLNTARRRRR